MNRWLGVGAALAGLAVALGAFGAHGLKSIVPAENLEWWHTGANYHLAHALAICLVALATRSGVGKGKSLPLFVTGIVLFSGSLYLMTVTSMRWLGAITPLGGVGFIGGWMWFALDAFRSNTTSKGN
jgi:uncharacterized membrane protein YgdD (TMEM256/DUF423 family)